MILIKQSIWRLDCIAAIDRYNSTVQIMLINTGEWFDIDFDDKNDALAAYKDLAEAFTSYIRTKRETERRSTQ